MRIQFNQLQWMACMPNAQITHGNMHKKIFDYKQRGIL